MAYSSLVTTMRAADIGTSAVIQLNESSTIHEYRHASRRSRDRP
jgi:hypothetical protein